MVVRLHLEHDAQAVANVDGARVFPRSLHHPRPRCRELFEMDARALVRTMLRPHDGKHAEFSDIRLPTQDFENLLVLVFHQIVLCQQFFNVSSVRLHKSLHITATALFSQDLDLRALRGDKGTLDSAATCQPLWQRASMLISANRHLLDQRVMPAIESLELAAPAQGLRMMRIAFL